MEAFLISTGVVALAEIGDKTQLLALVLAAKYRRPVPIILGIFVATLANHAMAGAVGAMSRFVFKRRIAHLGATKWSLPVALVAWDFLYYWDHRWMHEVRLLWANHVSHHSSERYNLSTALRQPVAEGLTMSVPYGLLALAGVRPSVIENARALNLIYQFWIHTEAVRSIGRLEHVLNTPSHHRVHHGTNRQYLDRNHGSILIVWDRLFGTFEREDERVGYGLTTNLDSFSPVTIATHEWRGLARDIAGPDATIETSTRGTCALEVPRI